MAKLKGILKIEGTLDELTFYKTQDGNLVKTKGGISASRIANDPAFARTRENGTEFANAASSGKVLRDALRPMLINTADNRVTSRLTQLMSQIKNLDTTSVRGERNVGVAIVLPTAQALLNGFNFNDKAILGAVLFKPFIVDLASGEIDIAGLVPINDIAFPQGATHLNLSGAFANVNFTDAISDIQFTNEVNLPIDGAVTNVALIPAGIPVGTGTNVYVLQIEFFQEVNGVQYTLNNGSYNSLAIVAVA